MNLIVNQGKIDQPGIEQMTVDVADTQTTVIRSVLSVPNQTIYTAFIGVITNNNYATLIENTPFDLECGRITSSNIGLETIVRDYNTLSQADKNIIIDFNTMINSL